jgi:hypothetical protein
MHAHELREIGEGDDRLFGVAAWRETTFFTAPERAALALAEAATRLSDRSDPVPDEAWNEASRLKGYPFLPAAYGELHLRAGRHDEAERHFGIAAALARNRAQKGFFERKLRVCRDNALPGNPYKPGGSHD